MPKVRKTTRGKQINKIVTELYEQPPHRQQKQQANIEMKLKMCADSAEDSADDRNKSSRDFYQTYYSLPPLEIKDELPDFEDDAEDIFHVDPDDSDGSKTRPLISQIIQSDRSGNISSESKFESQKGDTYECHYCQKKVSSLSIMWSHMKIHMTETMFGCEVCKKLYSTMVRMVFINIFSWVLKFLFYFFPSPTS
jgi:hypothetical protein